ncbi:MAG TPA: Spy/CpxP family protein refolding chaperone [Chitinophagaceae bacterium]|nr:Spy/CpxP family protein refolding chaperone [Chitinophagaceae bacterium]
MKNSTNRFLAIAVILLLVANIALVAFMFFGKSNKPSEKGGKAVFDKIVKELGMTEAQKAKYNSLREAHFSRIRPLFDTMRSMRQALFGLMKEPVVNDSLVKLYTTKISSKQTEADTLTLNHFREVRTLFTAEQKTKYDAFIQKMMQRPKKDSSGKKK